MGWPTGMPPHSNPNDTPAEVRSQTYNLFTDKIKKHRANVGRMLTRRRCLSELGRSDSPAIVCPVQKGLSLAGAAVQIPALAGGFDLANMSANRFPAPDLAPVLVG